MEERSLLDGVSSELLTFLGLILSNLVTWFFTRKKLKEETKSVEITNLESTFNFYKTIIGDLENRVDKLQEKLDNMENQIRHLEEENLNLKFELKKYKNEQN
jgi:peptidoglycan hydrolase CwlO-like protein